MPDDEEELAALEEDDANDSGDDFDEFEEGEEGGDDFGDFDDGFQEGQQGGTALVEPREPVPVPIAPSVPVSRIARSRMAHHNISRILNAACTFPPRKLVLLIR